MNSKSCWGQWLIVKLKTKVAVALRHLGSILIVQSYRNSPNSSSSHFIFSLYTVFVILGILIISWQNNGPGASDSRRGSCPRDTVWQFITPAELRGAGVITPSISDNNGCWYAASLPFNSTGQSSVSWYPCQEVFCNYQGECSRLLRCVCVCVRCCLSALRLSSSRQRWCMCVRGRGVLPAVHFQVSIILDLVYWTVNI